MEEASAASATVGPKVVRTRFSGYPHNDCSHTRHHPPCHVCGTTTADALLKSNLWRHKLPSSEASFIEAPASAFTPLMSDEDVAQILGVTIDWVRSHSAEIPGFVRLGMYYRFQPEPVREWLGGCLDQLLEVADVAALLKVPSSWVYQNADQVPGMLRLERYVRFRPAVIKKFLEGQTVAQ